MRTHSPVAHYPLVHSQRGVSLFITLIAVVALSFAGLALVRSVDTTNQIAGNLAFRQGALHATDVGIEAAYNALATITTSSNDANYPSACASGACQYYALKQATDTRGIPTVINWANVPETTVNSSYKVKYVIDRWCEGTLPVTDKVGQCSTSDAAGGGTKKAGGVVFSASLLTYYRITTQVTGPRNTISIVQALVLH